jgi:hypothetical protein
MFAMTSYFSLPKDTNWDDMRKLARRPRPICEVALHCWATV